MNQNDLALVRRKFALSAATLGRNRDTGNEGLRSPERPQPTRPLVQDTPREQTRPRGGEGRYRVSWTLYACHPLDWDNAAASVKPAQDALVELGWISGDDWKTLEGSARSVAVHSKAEERTEVVIERIA